MNESMNEEAAGLNPSVDTSSTGSTESALQENTPLQEYTPVDITLDSLLDAGAHFGHQVQRWNPKMMPYIFGERNGIHIINLDITLEYWNRAKKFVEDLSNRGGNILFVGTKQQARNIVKEAAERTGAYYVTQRWLGGTLSNFETIKRSISRMRKLEELLEEAANPDSKIKLNKKEQLSISRDLKKLEANLGGIREMRRLPDALFIVDLAKESIAVSEARNLQIPVVALVDTNVDPTLVDYPIPSNDDAARTLRLFVNGLADIYQSGRAAFLARGPKDEFTAGENGAGEVISGKKGARRTVTPAGSEKEGKKGTKEADIPSTASLP